MADATREVGSLPVANVQALAEVYNKGGDVQVPERYLAKDPRAEEVVLAAAVPVIDLHKLLDPESSEEECAKLGSACLDWGIFQIINHGVPDEVIGNLLKDVAGFLKQPLEAKKECAQQAGGLEGYGQAFVVSAEQKLDWADLLYLIVQPRESRDMRFWPTRPASFRHSVDSYSLEAAKLADELLEFMAKGVGADDPAVLRGMFQPQSMRFNHYPPCRQAADRVLGLSPHTDVSSLTLLLQMNNDVQGLQVKKDGKWFSVNVVDDAIVVNVGDALEIMSNGKFRSVEHRAVIDPSRERISVALFLHPFPNMMVGPLPEFLKPGDKERYRATSYEDFMKKYVSRKLDGRQQVEVLKVEQ